MFIFIENDCTALKTQWNHELAYVVFCASKDSVGMHDTKIFIFPHFLVNEVSEIRNDHCK